MQGEWAEWRDALEAANDPSFVPIEAIEEKLANGTAQFWCDGNVALVTEVVHWPGGAVSVDALAAAGDMAALNENIEPAVEKWASQFASHLRVIGRPGWAKVKRDWRHEQSILVRAL